MLRQRSKLAVAATKRPRLIHPFSLAAFSTLVIAALVLMFPFKVLVDRVLRDRRGDELTVSYLHNLLRTDPQNLEMVLRLARQQLAGGEYAGMRETLSPVLASPVDSDRVAARILLWEAGEHQWRKAPVGSSEREAILRQLLSELEALAALKIDEQTSLEIAERALDLGDRKLALKLYRTLGRNGMQFDSTWFAERARTLKDKGEYDAAVELFLIARSRAQTMSARRAYFQQAVKVPLARGTPRDALMLAERELGELRDDLESLIFMVELARSANQPSVASRYAHLMLRLSLLETMRQLTQGENLTVQWRHVADRGEHEDSKEGKAGTGGPALPFDDRIYTLGYEAFVGNHDLEDAYRVAESAVKQAPQNAVWRRRLAQVAEWLGRPAQALVQWRWLAEQQTGEAKEQEETAQALLRLAPGLFDDRALLIGLKFELTRNPRDTGLLLALIATYERIGEPEEGIALLQRLVRIKPARESMQALADLAERAARPELAIATLRQINARFGVDRDRSMKLAAMLIARGSVGDAYNELKVARGRIAADDESFWRTFGALAQRMQEDGQAREAYSRLIALDSASVSDFDSLIALLGGLDPLQAGDLSMRAARRFDSWQHVLAALDFYAAAKLLQKAGQVFEEIDAQPDQHWLLRGENNPRFLALRAAYWRELGRLDIALKDYQRWFALAPEDAEVREAILWLLIDRHDGVALKTLLAKHESDWAHEPRLHDVLAAAWLTLSIPRVALERYLTPRLASHRDDFLWLMNYADALEQDQQSDFAWRLRQKLWRDRRLQPELPEHDQAAAQQQLLREARVRLAMSQTPGDKGLSSLRELLRLDRVALAKPGAVSDELWLAWLMAQTQQEAAQGYLWSRYAQKFSQPEWATLALALANGDDAMAGELLIRRSGALPRYDAVTAAQTIGANNLAATLVFETQDLQRDDEPLQLQMADVLWDQASKIGVDFDLRHYKNWLEREVHVRYDTTVSSGLRLSMDLGEVSRGMTQTLQDVRDERYANLAFIHRDGAYETKVGIGYREGFGDWLPVSFSQTLFATGTWDLSLIAGWRQTATENQVLRALARRNLVGLEGGYRFARTDRLGLSARRSFYYTQNGISLGRGETFEGHWQHNLRSEAPESSAELFWSYNRFKARDTFDATDEVYDVANRIVSDLNDASARVATLMPGSYVQYGARWQYGDGLDGKFSRAFRPYASLALTYSTGTGIGYAVMGGFARSLLGRDRLATGFTTEKGASGSSQQNTTVGIRYWMAY